MKKSILTTIALLILTVSYSQFGDSFTRVDAIPGNKARITNLQAGPTDYLIRKPDSTFFSTGIVAAGASIDIEITPCGWGQVLPQTNNTPGIEPHPEGIEFTNCTGVLPVEEKEKWTQDGNVIEVWIPVGKVIDKTKPQKVRIGLADGSYRVVEFPLTDKRGQYYYYKLKL